MKGNNLVFSLFHTLTLLMMFLASGFLLGLYYSPYFRVHIASLMQERPAILFTSGSLLSALSIFLLAALINAHRRRFYKVAMGTSKTLIEESIIREYVKNYWETLFPEKHCEVEIVIHGSSELELIAQIPESSENQDELLKRIQNELGVILARMVGHEKEFTLTITES